MPVMTNMHKYAKIIQFIFPTNVRPLLDQAKQYVFPNNHTKQT